MSNIHHQIERSSLGAPSAQAARSTVSTSSASKLVARANAMPRPKPIPRKKSGG